jgi:hypothetical protein
MGSEKEAKAHLDFLRSFSQLSSRPFPGLVKLSQREQIAGIKADYIVQASYACGELAAALDADDREYFLIMLTIFDMKLKNVSAYSGMEALVQTSVPAYALLGKAIGRSAEQTKRLVWEDKARVDVAADALLAMFKLQYRGSMEAGRKK